MAEVPMPPSCAENLVTVLPERTSDAPHFAAEYRIRAGDVDQDMRVRLDSIARYLQDVANDNLAASTFGSSDPFWLVRRTVIDVVEPISWPGTVLLERWCSALSTRWANMRVRMNATSEVDRLNPNPRPAGLIETESFWINVNEAGMPARISDGGFEYLSSMTSERRLRWKQMNSSVPPDPHTAGTADDRLHILRATDFDPLRHMNNSAYWAVIEDELIGHPDLKNSPHRAVIEYLRPVAPHSRMTVRRSREGDRLSIWMIVDDCVSTTVTVTKTRRPTTESEGAPNVNVAASHMVSESAPCSAHTLGGTGRRIPGSA
ncbi:acyl-[acyl-carrier-protein] thioesterase [Rhodococcus erythropolis]|uniref:acyl-[acyl-carrier-protein] thioesterase n=1 Tax=Rhodococcus erythropolis TaxID=1833 RepID=UPI003013C111